MSLVFENFLRTGIVLLVMIRDTMSIDTNDIMFSVIFIFSLKLRFFVGIIRYHKLNK